MCDSRATLLHVADSDDYVFSFLPDYQRSVIPSGVWVHVTGGPLPMDVEIRLDQTADGRWVVTGLMMGGEFDHLEITSQTLREIKLREIVASLLDDYDPDAPPDWTKFAGRVAVVLDVNSRSDAVPWKVKAPPRGPDDQSLKDFAHTYRSELARQPHRAMSAAAKKHGISRATANRWAAECRRLGYLPGGNTD